MFFDDPRNALSVARTHQRELLQQEQMDRLARQAEPSNPDPTSPGLISLWKHVCAGGRWLKTHLAMRPTAPVKETSQLRD